MGLINKTSKAIRLLLSRRFTTGSLADSQEAFTSTLDIQASEVYTEANLVPTSSLPFSGSSQTGATYSTAGSNVMRYWYRHRLTKHNIGHDVWFFLNPTGSADGITPQLINTNQKVNFISNKYAISSLATANSEDSTPGYNVKVFKSTATNSGSFDNDDVVSTTDYAFDYKTGILQFDQNAPNSNDIVYVTAYQYVGKTLDEGISFTGDTTLVSVSSSMIPNADDAFDIGTTTKQWKDLFVDGTANIDTLSLTDAFTYNGVTFNTSGSNHLSLTGSSFDFKSTNSSNLLSLYNSSDEVVFKFDDKVLTLGTRTTTPTAAAGGMFYSGSDEWFLAYSGTGLP